MVPNIHDDNLEKFLQKAFEHFEEDPSAGLWDKIEAGLPPAAAPTALRVMLSRWALRAAVLLLLGWSVYQFFWFKGEMDQLNQELNCTRIELQDLQQLQTLPETLAIEKVVFLPVAPSEKLDSHPASRIPHLDPLTPPAQNLIFGLEEAAKATFAAIDYLPATITPLSIAFPELNGAVAPASVMLSQNTRRWRVGGQTALGHTSYSQMSPPDFGPGPGRPAPLREAVREEVEFSRNASVGLSLQYDIDRNWSMETGLQYRRFSSRFSHQPVLRFGEHLPHQGGPNQGHVYDFAYYVNTPSGAAYISLSAEQTDPGEVIPEAEDLQVRITTEDRLDLLTIPLLLGRQLGQGRINGQLRGGLLVNIGLDQDSRVSGVDYGNQKFKPMHGNGHGVQLKPPGMRAVSFDYFLSAGVAFDVTPSWRLNLMPFVSGSLSSKIDALYDDPSDFTAGLSVGVSRLF